LDKKIQRLSSDWIAAINWYEPEWPESTTAMERRKKFLGAFSRNARWKLDAIDFFNDELMRFLSFNNGILASIEDVIIVCDPDGRVVYQNPAAKRLPGYRDSPGAASSYLSALLDGRKFDMRPGVLHFVPGHDGKTFYNVTVAPISAAGVVFSLHDATAQHELDQAKSEMVSLVSHELRTPLTSIRGYSDMLLKYGLVEDKGKEFLKTIVDESNRLNQLIQSFLDIAYIESGRQKITKTDFEIAPVLADMVNIITPVAAQKQITLEAPGDLNDLRVRADRLLLYQALSNLVTNAIKYSPEGTKVSIGVSNGNGAVRFRVADQGYGIPADEASKIFEKFYRRGNKETREQSGFGLGLAFVKEVAMRHGGDVVVESEVGKGSAFTLWIPN
jgi:signal transduction histidine kinase